jgi:hypothetical protein
LYVVNTGHAITLEPITLEPITLEPITLEPITFGRHDPERVACPSRLTAEKRQARTGK